jgi:biotin-dependent carboxylase-like uncharacterized protein
MDRYALSAANLLVGNAEGAAGLEAVFMGPELLIERDTVLAVTGAELPIKLDGVEQAGWTAFAARAWQTLSFGYLQRGARIYIAVAGGVDVPQVLGSRSTYVVGALGGHEGRALKAGDRLRLGTARASNIGASVPAQWRRGPAAPAELRVLPGIYVHRITQRSLDRFFADEWKVASEADRMGYRFRGGQPMEFVPRVQPFGAGENPSNIVDAPYAYGSIQIPGGLEPIILHRDAVSAGGYFTLGAVISADMDLIAQLQPNAPARFVRVDMATAIAARKERATMLDSVRRALA